MVVSFFVSFLVCFCMSTLIQEITLFMLVQDTKLKSVDRSLKRHISISLGKIVVKIKYTVLQNNTHCIMQKLGELLPDR